MTIRGMPAASAGRVSATAGPAGDTELRAIETVGGVITDLVGIAERLPVRHDELESIARILDRLSQEISEAATLLRAIPNQ